MRTFVCSEGGERECSSSVGLHDTTGRAAETRTFAYEGYDPVAPAAARAFIAAERAAIDALPPLSSSAALASAGDAFDAVARAAVRVDVGSRPLPEADENVTARFSLDLAGASGARVRLVDLGDADEIGAVDVTAYRSPDGRYVALAVRSVTSTMCWDFTAIDVRVIDIARTRAQLANTIGFRAYRAGRMREALDDFTEATSIDPTHALAWHDRASVESRTGDVTAALASETRAIALDASMAARACRDDDFRALRATSTGSTLLGCTPR